MQIGYIGGAVAGAAAGVQAVFEYNQKNFKYDREMRQKTEFKTREWRNAQCDLWRDDVREIIGLTEKKMDSYLLIGTLQLGMSVVLFCEGRLEPGTPPWLMHMYIMAIVGAFMYLLMSVWLAMHASIVAQCSEVRLLTQFIRRPIPTWEELQDMRTFAQTYEHLESGQVMRVPFTGTAKPDQDHARGETTKAFGAPFGSSKPSSTVGALPSPDAAERAIDPWFKEAHAEDRQGLYELMQMPVERRRHIYLARRSAAQYQAFDAFTRTALSCGTHQLLSAVAYYCIGYCSIQDGAPWPAFCVAFVMVAGSVAVAYLDLSMTSGQQKVAVILLIAGPLLSATMAWGYAQHMPWAEPMVFTTFPLAAIAHASWLLFSLRLLNVQKQQNGSYLPMKFRAVLYLDIFGWFRKSQVSTPTASKRSMDYFKLSEVSRYNTMAPEFEVVPQAEKQSDSEESISLLELQESLREEISMWRDVKVWPHLDAEERKKVVGFAKKYEGITGEVIPASSPFPTARSPVMESTPRPWLKMSGYADTGKEAPYLFQPNMGEVIHLSEAGDPLLEHIRQDLPEDVRELHMVEADLEVLEDERDEFQLQRAAAGKTRRKGRHITVGPSEVCEYMVGDEDSGPDDQEDQELNKEIRKRRRGMDSYSPFGKRAHRPEHNKLHGEPDEDVLVGYGDLQPGVVPWQIFWRGTVVLAICWVLGALAPFMHRRDMLVKNQQLIGGEMGMGGELDREVHHEKEDEARRKRQRMRLKDLDWLPGGQLVKTYWPEHSGFQPRALSCDPLGLNIVVADDFGLYAADLNNTPAQQDAGKLRGKTEGGLVARFVTQPHCTAIEGHGLQDVSVACVHGQNSSKHCRVMVLHEHGRILSECDLRLQAPKAKVSTEEADDLPSWDITTSWLRDDGEYVTSAAVSSKCLKPIIRILEDGKQVTGEFKPQVMDGGCVVVGTSIGRIIELRTHYFNHTKLVPEMAMRQWVEPVSQGALHVLNNGVVVGIRDRSSVHAFDVASGTRIGEWRLPDKKVHWAHLCGGGESLFILGHDEKTLDARLFRFKMPQEIQDFSSKEEIAEHRKLEI